MSAPLFFVEAVEPGSLTLSEADSRHALRSLRLRPGAELTVVDGRGSVGKGRLAREERGLAVVEVESVSRAVRRGPLVSVALVPPKGERLAWAVQKLAELGVDEVVLIRSERSVREVLPGRADRVLERLRAVAREAAMQSRQPFVMEVADGMDLDGALEAGGSPVVVLWERADTRLRDALPDEVSGIRLVVGPEGGLSKEEARRATEAGAALASLGEPILRTETAAVVGAALVLARFGRLG